MKQKTLVAKCRSIFLPIRHVLILISAGLFLLLPPTLFAQHLLPPFWQRSDSDYKDRPWTRDANANHIDDAIDSLSSNEHVDIVVCLRKYVSQDSLRSKYKLYIDSTVVSDRDLFISNIITFLFVPNVRVDKVKNEIIQQPEVFLIELAGTFIADLDNSVANIKVADPSGTDPNTVWHLSQFPMIVGTGIPVAILDSGVDNAYESSNVYAVADYYDFSTSTPTATNPNDALTPNHGTMMARIILGMGMGTTYKGVAPSASLVDVKALFQYNPPNLEVGADFGKVTQALEWIISNGAVKIVNMSFSRLDVSRTEPRPWYSDGTDAFSQLVNYAVAQGKVCVASAGNYGSAGAITTPGAAARAITVAAYDDQDMIPRTNYVWASSSSYGYLKAGPITTIDREKPDLVAPGVNILSGTGASAQNFTGTSAAAAHISGLAALLLQYKPAMTPACVKALLMESAEKKGPGGTTITAWHTQVGHGFVDAIAAFDRLCKTTDIIFEVFPAGSPHSGQLIGWNAAANNVEVRLKNNGTRAAKNIYVDIGFRNPGIAPPYPDFFTHIGTQLLATSLDPGASSDVTIPYRLTISPPMDIRAIIRYGQDSDCANNIATRNWPIPSETTFPPAEAAMTPAFMTKSDTLKLFYPFHVFTASPAPVNLTMSYQYPNHHIIVSFDKPVIQVDRTKPPVQVVATVKSHKNDITGDNIRFKAINTGNQTLYGEILGELQHPLNNGTNQGLMFLLLLLLGGGIFLWKATFIFGCHHTIDDSDQT